MSAHNHTAKGIRRYGQCPACDEYRQTRQWIPVQPEAGRAATYPCGERGLTTDDNPYRSQA